ncbi:unnamed protein product [Cuscuta campestris]|uniref:Uncharacterized protein n=1 Tax=Cuscuta campestris TaxID=132261 RepID=A0A484ND74_9ASTE|nr:unnamed protein product [Cuscuta campestris]
MSAYGPVIRDQETDFVNGATQPDLFYNGVPHGVRGFETHLSPMSTDHAISLSFHPQSWMSSYETKTSITLRIIALAMRVKFGFLYVSNFHLSCELLSLPQGSMLRTMDTQRSRLTTAGEGDMEDDPFMAGGDSDTSGEFFTPVVRPASPLSDREEVVDTDEDERRRKRCCRWIPIYLYNDEGERVELSIFQLAGIGGYSSCARAIREAYPKDLPPLGDGIPHILWQWWPQFTGATYHREEGGVLN